MGILEKNIQEEGFNAKIFTLTCEETGKKLANIMVRKSNDELPNPIYINIEATSPFSPGSTSGKHRVGGLLAYGPISKEDSPRFPTIITDVTYLDTETTETVTLRVEKA